MKNLKKVLALVLVVAMMMSFAVSASAAFEDQADVSYTEAVDVMAAIKVLEGNPDGTFNPQGTLTREQAAKIIAYATLGKAKAEKLSTDASNFADVEPTRWSAKYIEYCFAQGIIDGVSATKFNPTGKLTGTAFAKMLLVAIGFDAKAEGMTGASWAINTAKLVNDIQLDNGMVGFALNAEISREEAAQLALNAINYSKAGGKTTYVLDGMEFDSLTDAAIYKNLTGSTGTIAKVTSKTDSLASKVFGLSCAEKTDDFGRTANVWTSTADKDLKVVSVTETAVVTYTAAATAKAVAADLKGYTYDGKKVEGTDKAANTVASVVDGTDVASVATTKTPSEIIAGLTASGKTVEVYADKDKKITKIVVVADHFGTVSAVDEKEGTVTVAGKTFKTTDFKKDAEVIYTVGKNGIVTLEAVDTVVGTLTSYTKAGKYSINGSVYELSAIDGVTTVAGDITSVIGKEKLFGLDKAGKIVSVNAVPGQAEEEVVITDYAVILDAAASIKTTGGLWAADSTTEVAAQIKVLLSNGTVEVWDVPVMKADKDISKDVKKGDFYYYLASKTATKVDLAAGNTALAAALKKAGVFTYADKALVAPVAAYTGTETKDANVVTANTVALTKGTFTDGKVILNDKTVFVVKNAKGEYVVKTGVAALEATSIAAGKATVIVNVTAGKGADGKPDASKNVNVATVVFSDVAFEGAAAQTTKDYVYVDGDCAASVDAEGATVYTYTVVKADGTATTVTAKDDTIKTGVYTLKTDGSIDTSELKEVSKKTVTLVSGTTVVFSDNTAATTTAKTTVAAVAEGATLAAEAEGYFAIDNGAIVAAFLTK